MNKRKLFASIIIVFGIVLIKTVSYAQNEVIKFGTLVYPPFVMLDANKEEFYGFDIEIAKALCKQMKVTCTFGSGKLNNITKSLNDNTFDAWIGALSIKEERQKDIAFSKPYFSSTAHLIATKNTTFNGAPIEIKNKNIGVEEHSCHIQALKNSYGNIINIKIFPAIEDCYAALENYKIDAIISDTPTLKHWRLTHQSKRFRLIGLPAKYSNLVWQKYGIAIAKDNPALVKKINTAINQIKADGTYNKLVKKYFDY